VRHSVRIIALTLSVSLLGLAVGCPMTGTANAQGVTPTQQSVSAMQPEASTQQDITSTQVAPTQQDITSTLQDATAAPQDTGTQQDSSQGGFLTTQKYLQVFYPLWFYYYQSALAPTNQLIGPDRMGPLFGEVVAPNDDTLYVGSFVNPVILTIPETTATYSLLTLDYFGNIFDSGIQPATPGTYALIGPGWTGTLPEGVAQITVPVVYSGWVLRADKFSNGEDQTAAAEEFRKSLHLAPLAEYLIDHDAGAARILPLALYSIRFKVLADTEIAVDPIAFLKQLQRAVAAPSTPPLSASEQALSDKFDSLFGNGDATSSSGFAAGARAALAQIVVHYRTHTGPTNWITFTNIGDWGRQYLDRAAITEYIQVGNGHSTAAYYQTFTDGEGALLDGGSTSGYVLTFPEGQVPEAKRFWSVTAYLPSSITLVPNSANKYVVGSYTPGLVTNSDGSISIYLAPELPSGVPEANWLPVPGGKFNVMLRVYGPEGSVADNAYVPPAIERLDLANVQSSAPAAAAASQ
jgi:hypothetical protein